MLEMNFEVLQHFLGSLLALLERLRGMYRDACQVTRQSLEFGESSLGAARGAGSRVRRHPVLFVALVTALVTLVRRVLLPRLRMRDRTTSTLASAWLSG